MALSQVDKIHKVSIIPRYGMDANLGSVSYESEKSSFLGDRTSRYFERNYSEATAEAMDHAVREVLRDASERALKILTENRPVLNRAANRLLDVETLDETALREFEQELQRAAPDETTVTTHS